MGRVYKRGEIYHASYTDHDGKRVQRSTGTKTKKLAEKIVTHWENESTMVQTGMIDLDQVRQTRQSKRPLCELIEQFITSLTAKKRDPKHVRRVRMHISRIAVGDSVRSLNSTQVEAYAARLADQGASARTIQSHLQSIKQFSRWLHKNNFVLSDPLISVEKPNPDKDRRYTRRGMSHEEFAAFIKDIPRNPSTGWKLDGAARALLYRVAILTGLRANELFTLQTDRLNLSNPPFFVLAKSSDTKNGELARQWIGEDTAAMLSEHTKRNPLNRTAFQGMPNSDGTAAMFRDDLDFARSCYRNATDPADPYFLAQKNRSGDDLDFHSLRYTCGAWLALDKVHPKAIQTVMRHSTITLTMDRYGHLFPSMEHEAIRSLERFL